MKPQMTLTVSTEQNRFLLQETARRGVLTRQEVLRQLISNAMDMEDST